MCRSLMEKATALGKLEDMCNKQDAAGKTPFDMAAAGQHKVGDLQSLVWHLPPKTRTLVAKCLSSGI